MSNTHRHKLCGKYRRYSRSIRHWYWRDGGLYDSILYKWPTFLLGPEPHGWSTWSNPTQEFRQHYNRVYRHRTNQLVRQGRYDDVVKPHHCVHWEWY